MFATLAPLLASGVGSLVDWMRKRSLLKDAYARNFYAWVDYQGERHAWPVTLRERFRAQRVFLDELAKAKWGEPPGESKG